MTLEFRRHPYAGQSIKVGEAEKLGMKVIIVKDEPEFPKFGLWGQMSWQRFADEVLRSAKEIGPGEQVVEIEATEEWIRFKVERK